MGERDTAIERGQVGQGKEKVVNCTVNPTYI